MGLDCLHLQFKCSIVGKYLTIIHPEYITIRISVNYKLSLSLGVSTTLHFRDEGKVKASQ